MELAGEIRFDHCREWFGRALLDADMQSRCPPGFERYEQIAEMECAAEGTDA